MLHYTVRCTFEDRDVGLDWAEWLLEEHLEDVVAAGALTGEVHEVSEQPLAIEARYTFSDRAAFDRYEREHAPRLRAEGLARFPLTLGLTYARSTTEDTPNNTDSQR